MEVGRIEKGKKGMREEMKRENRNRKKRAEMINKEESSVGAAAPKRRGKEEKWLCGK